MVEGVGKIVPDWSDSAVHVFHRSWWVGPAGVARSLLCACTFRNSVGTVSTSPFLNSISVICGVLKVEKSSRSCKLLRRLVCIFLIYLLSLPRRNRAMYFIQTPL